MRTHLVGGSRGRRRSQGGREKGALSNKEGRKAQQRAAAPALHIDIILQPSVWQQKYQLKEFPTLTEFQTNLDSKNI